MPDLETKLRRLQETTTILRKGRVAQVVGMTIEGQGPTAALGEVCWIELPDGSRRPVEVVGFRDSRILLMPLGELEGIRPGLPIVAEGRPFSIPVGPQLLGRVLDSLGRPIDGKGPLAYEACRPLTGTPSDPLRRERISKRMPLGVKAVDGLITCGLGQRLGIFGGSGVGKSTLMGMFARHAHSDLNVIALIGERGREVRDFIERDLGPQGLARSVVVVVTSDQPALLRVKGAFAAAAIAEYFRDRGAHVLLMMDSVTRMCLAQREIGLAVGEPPTTRGFTPSVFSLLPKLLERSGMGEHGSITGLYTVLVEGDDMDEPIADAARSILDGDVVISRDLAAANHFPAIDVLRSQSRIFRDITSAEHLRCANWIRNHMAVYAKARDLLDVGAYAAGSNREIDAAVKVWPQIQEFLRQRPEETTEFDAVIRRMGELTGQR